MDLERRRKFAAEICARTRVTSPRLVAAFAAVPREPFFGRGPWSVLKAPGGYRLTPDDDPRHLYRDLTIAIDAERSLHSGQPSLIALLIHHLGLEGGERVVHIGCGAGYFSAVLAELVGSEGSVLAVEVDAGLAAQARENLEHWSTAEVVQANGTTTDLGAADAILVHAGVTRPPEVWFESLIQRGRLVFPLTDSAGHGGCLRVLGGEIGSATLEARFVLYGGAFPCAGARSDPAAAGLHQAYAMGGWERVRCLRRDAHARDANCWLHERGFCLASTGSDSGSA